jgi:hypothetical protein
MFAEQVGKSRAVCRPETKRKSEKGPQATAAFSRWRRAVVVTGLK